MNDYPEDYPYQAPRMPVMARNMVATSQPLAVQAGIDMLRRGGEANGKRFLSPSTLNWMRQNWLEDDIASMGTKTFAEMPMEGMGFGIGWSVVLEPARVRMAGNVGDYAWGGMASTFWWNDPVADLTCIFYTQLTPSSSYPNRAQLKSLVHGAMVGG